VQSKEVILSTQWMPMVTQSSCQPVRRKRSRKSSRRRLTLKPRLRLKQPEELRLKRPQLPKGRKGKRVAVAPWLNWLGRNKGSSQRLRLLLMLKTMPERSRRRDYKTRKTQSRGWQLRRGTLRNKSRETEYKS
jgi:hypothetical protein